MTATTDLDCLVMTIWDFRAFVQGDAEVPWKMLEHGPIDRLSTVSSPASAGGMAGAGVASPCSSRSRPPDPLVGSLGNDHDPRPIERPPSGRSGPQAPRAGRSPGCTIEVVGGKGDDSSGRTGDGGCDR